MRSCKSVCLHHAVDVTARRNTIANALELVKVTKGKVNTDELVFNMPLNCLSPLSECHSFQSGRKGILKP